MALFTSAILGTLVGSVSKIGAVAIASRAKSKQAKTDLEMFKAETIRVQNQNKHERYFQASQNKWTKEMKDAGYSHEAGMQDMENDHDLQISADDLQKAAIQADALTPIVQKKDSFIQKLRVSVRPVLSYYLVLIVSLLAGEYVFAQYIEHTSILDAKQFNLIIFGILEAFSSVIGFVFGSRIVRD
jgi:hypothetical protein